MRGALDLWGEPAGGVSPGRGLHGQDPEGGKPEELPIDQVMRLELDVHFVNPSPVFCLDKTGDCRHAQMLTMSVLPDTRQGLPLCQSLMHPQSPWRTRNGHSWSHSPVRTPLPKRWRSVVVSSCGRRPLTTRPTVGSLPRCAVIAIRRACGAVAIFPKGWQAFRMRRAQDDRGAFPPAERITVMAIATSKPADAHCPATRWSVDDIAATLGTQTAAPVLSRSTIWRILDDADLKPHRSVYWLNSHDPAFEAKAHAICAAVRAGLALLPRTAAW